MVLFCAPPFQKKKKKLIRSINRLFDYRTCHKQEKTYQNRGPWWNVIRIKKQVDLTTRICYLLVFLDDHTWLCLIIVDYFGTPYLNRSNGKDWKQMNIHRRSTLTLCLMEKNKTGLRFAKKKIGFVRLIINKDYWRKKIIK